MDPLDQRIPIEQVLEQEKKWVDAVKLASVTPKDRDPVFANNVVWWIHNGYSSDVRSSIPTRQSCTTTGLGKG